MYFGVSDRNINGHTKMDEITVSFLRDYRQLKRLCLQNLIHSSFSSLSDTDYLTYEVVAMYCTLYTDSNCPNVLDTEYIQKYLNIS